MKIAQISATRSFFAGGAPLSPETHEFVRTVMGCPILQAYGLTETCANTTAMDIHDNSTGAVGHITTQPRDFSVLVDIIVCIHHVIWQNIPM